TAVHPAVAAPDPDPRERLRAARRAPRGEGGALPQLAHQPPGQRRGHHPDRAGAGGHDVLVLRHGPARALRGLPGGLRPAPQKRHSRSQAQPSAPSRLRPPMKETDIVIIGGGHNGLVCAFYLARTGLKVTVLERREVVGGAAVTEEFHPGFRNSTASYTVSL